MFDTFTQNYTPPENEYVSALFAAIPGHYAPQDPSVRAGWIPEALERNNAYVALEAADALLIIDPAETNANDLWVTLVERSENGQNPETEGQRPKRRPRVVPDTEKYPSCTPLTEIPGPTLRTGISVGLLGVLCAGKNSWWRKGASMA